MKFLVVAVRDAAAEMFLKPFMVRAEGEATRDFEKVLNTPNENSPMYHHPEHFQLFKLGTWNDNTGLYEAGVPTIMLQGIEIAKQRPQQEFNYTERSHDFKAPDAETAALLRKNGDAR